MLQDIDGGARWAERKIINRTAIMRPLDPSDPRSLDHPSQSERWLEFASAIGRAIGARYFEEVQAMRRGPILVVERWYMGQNTETGAAILRVHLKGHEPEQSADIARVLLPNI
jgi:hypothetical protein